MSKQLVIKEEHVSGFLAEIKKSLENYHGGSGKMSDFLRNAMLMITESKDLKECLKTDAGKSSLWHALKYAASTGLSLNPQEGKAALIPYSGSINYQVMKNGLIDLAHQSGKVAFITSDTVRSADDFKIKKTMNGDEYEYIPARKTRGDIDGFFSAIKLTDGTCHVKYMTDQEVKAHRDQYSALFKSKPNLSPWTKSYEGMGLKTVIKALFRNLSISSEIDKAVGIDDKTESGELRDVSEPGFTTQSEEIKKDIEQPKAEPEPVKSETEKKGDVF